MGNSDTFIRLALWQKIRRDTALGALDEREREADAGGRLRRLSQERDRGKWDFSELRQAGTDRERQLRGRRRHHREDTGIAPIRDRIRDRRLRHGIFFPPIPVKAALGRIEDRPILRSRARRGFERCGVRAGDHRMAKVLGLETVAEGVETSTRR